MRDGGRSEDGCCLEEEEEDSAASRGVGDTSRAGEGTDWPKAAAKPFTTCTMASAGMFRAPSSEARAFLLIPARSRMLSAAC